MNELDLFAAAIAIADPTERGSLLDRECAGRPEIRQRLNRLLEAHVQPHPMLDHSNRRKAEMTGAYETLSPLVGTIIAGRYKLLEEIGDGGMGTVWMAEQKEPVKRLVAVKLIKAGMDSKAVLARFEAERQALALMDHPNIAKVHDAGTDDAGRPYFVMELVKGLPLTEYCDARKLSVNDRLDLFIQICSAVQHAHQKAVIHRDLKPTNVLVTEHDGKPVPKVIDFGLAKSLHGTNTLTDRTLHTAYGTVVGTPLYMAPEQVGINALDVDTRTDIYALGVMLYELLTGTTPLEKAKFKEAAWEEMKRLIREEEPPKPSTRLSSAATLPSLAASRQIEPAQLARLIRGELDWIVMKALEKDRTRRYETATGLAKDVQRYLAGDAVEACPPTLGYWLRKAYRRNRGAVLVGSTLAAVLLLATGVSLAFGVLAKQAERRADDSARQAKDSERDAQQRLAELIEARKQQAESDYLMSIQFADAGYRYGNLGTARSLLAAAPLERRGWEWHYLNRQCRGDQLHTFHGNGRPLRTAAFNHDGTLVITTSDEQVAKVWDARTWSLKYVLPRVDSEQEVGEQIAQASFSSDGRRILTDSYSSDSGEDSPKAVKLWDAKTGKLIRTLQKNVEWVNQAAFSPDSRWVVTCHRDNIAKVWDAETGDEKVTLEGHTRSIHRAVFIRKCTRLVTTSFDGTVRVWDIESGKETIPPFTQHKNTVWEVAGSPADDGRTVASQGTGTDRGVWVWDSETGKVKFKLGGGSDRILSPRFSPDGTKIIAYNLEGSVKVYDAHTGAELLKINIAVGAPQVMPQFTPDGTKLLLQANDGSSVTIHDAGTGTLLKTLKGHARLVERATFSPDGHFVLTLSTDGTAKIWDASPTPGPLDFITESFKNNRGSIRTTFVGGDSPQIAVLAQAEASDQWIVSLWDLKSKEKLFSFTLHSRSAPQLHFSPDGKRVVIPTGRNSDHDPTVFVYEAGVWDAGTGKRLCTLAGTTAFIFSPKFSPDGKWIVGPTFGSANDSTVKVWNAETGAVERELIGHTEMVRSAEFSSDGESILTASRDKTLKIWDVATGTARQTLSSEHRLESASFSPDSKRILTIGFVASRSQAQVWDLASEKPLYTLGTSGIGLVAAFSPDGTRIITANNNDPATLWDAETGRELLTFGHMGRNFWTPWFTPDSHWIVLSDRNGRAVVFDGTPLPEPKK
jgi:WD40 repeat protein/serine/threonine protein kinase